MHKNIALALGALLMGCATTGGPSQQDVLDRNGPIAELRDRVESAEGAGAALLGSQSLKKAKMHLAEALDSATSGDDAAAERAAAQGLKVVERVDAVTATSKQELDLVLTTRNRAIAVGAQSLYVEAFDKADDELVSTTKQIEDGRVATARGRRPKLIERYSKLELQALEEGTLEVAKAAVKAAEDADADEYARRTLKEARQEIELAKSILQADRTEVNKARRHTERATWLAGVARAITSVAKMFEKGDYDPEAIVLWHQRQLEYVNVPLETELPLASDNQAVVVSMRRNVGAVVAALAAARETSRDRQETINDLRASLEREKVDADRRISEVLAKSEAEIEKLKSARGRDLARQRDQSSSAMVALRTEYERKLSAEEEARKNLEKRQKRENDRMERAQALFEPSQAKILVEAGDVIIQAHGFVFRPGRSEISAENFGLLSKIAEAIASFPGARIEVRGHTDATGAKDTNRALSASRAENVLEFLVKTKSVDRQQISAIGEGSDRPIATNATSEGRARNRRIEVRIVPKTAVSSL